MSNVSQDQQSATIINSNTPYTNKQLEFMIDRMMVVTRISVPISIVVLLIGFAFSALTLPADYYISDNWAEWKPLTDGNCDNEDDPACVGDIFHEIGLSVNRLVLTFTGLINSITSEDNTRSNMGGIARLLSVISISIAVFFAYRTKLEDRYEMSLHKSQLNDFRQLKQTRYFHITRGLYIVATFFGTYVLTSLIWLILSQAFKQLEFGIFPAWLTISIFVFGGTFAATFWASAVTTRELVMIGAGTFVVGFFVSFVVSPPMKISLGGVYLDGYWWQGAISSAGKLVPSAPLFTASLTSLAIVCGIVWFDIDSILEQAITNCGRDKTPLIKLGSIELIQTNQLWLIRVLYSLVIIGLISIGLARVGQPISEFFLNFFAHTLLGAGGAIIGMFLVCRHVSQLTTETILTQWYNRYFIFAFVASSIAMFLSSLQLSPEFKLGMSGDINGVINLTSAELVIFTLSGVLLIATIEMLLLHTHLLDNLPIGDGQEL